MRAKFTGAVNLMAGYGIPPSATDLIIADGEGTIVHCLKHGSIVNFPTAGTWWIDNEHLQIITETSNGD